MLSKDPTAQTLYKSFCVLLVSLQKYQSFLFDKILYYYVINYTWDLWTSMKEY